MSFSIIIMVTFEIMLLMEEKAKRIRVVYTSNSHSLNQKKQACKTILNKSIYKDVCKALIDISLKFLQFDFLAKKLT